MNEAIHEEETKKLDVTDVQFRAIIEVVCNAKSATVDFEPATKAILDDGSLLVSLLHQHEKQLPFQVDKKE